MVTENVGKLPKSSNSPQEFKQYLIMGIPVMGELKTKIDILMQGFDGAKQEPKFPQTQFF